MSHTASRTWISRDVQERESFTKLRENMARFVPKSPLIPRTVVEWKEHKAAMLDASRAEMKVKIDTMQAWKARADKVKIQLAFDGRVFEDYFGAVLSWKTIFTKNHTLRDGRPEHAGFPTSGWTINREPREGWSEAEWPSADELKHEGDDRLKSGFRRFLPLPRKVGNSTVNWKAKGIMPTFCFDAFSLPQGIERPPETDSMMVSLVGESLMSNLNR